MEFKFNDAKSARPGHLERCLCYDKYLKGYRCYVYDDISKYWCTQATTEHDPDGENHIVDYADFQVTEWASLSNENKPSLPSNLDEAAEEYGRKEYSHAIHFWDEGLSKNKPEVMKEDFVDSFKAGAEWMAGQGYTFETIMQEDDVDELVPTCPDMYNYGYSYGNKVIVQIRKKQ